MQRISGRAVSVHIETAGYRPVLQNDCRYDRPLQPERAKVASGIYIVSGIAARTGRGKDRPSADAMAGRPSQPDLPVEVVRWGEHVRLSQIAGVMARSLVQKGHYDRAIG